MAELVAAAVEAFAIVTVSLRRGRLKMVESCGSLQLSGFRADLDLRLLVCLSDGCADSSQASDRCLHFQ